MLKRTACSFAISCCVGLIVYMLMEFVAGVIIGVEGFCVMTPEYLSLFPSETLALGVAVLSHGLIGASFAAATVIYKKVEIGFILQNVIYFFCTGIVWIPLICFVWRLYRYPAALFYTVGGFVLTYIIMSVLGYQITKKDVARINARLAEDN